MDDSFLAALYPGEFRVCGYRLRPYCAGHLAALCVYGSPFATSGTETGAAELLQALRICETAGFPLPSATQLRPRFFDRVKGWWLGRSETRLRAAATAFETYRLAHYSFPDFYNNEATAEEESDGRELSKHKDKKRPLSAPFLLARVCALIGRTTLTEAQVWQMPLALPSWYIGTLDELEGAPVRFLYESDEEEDDMPVAVEDMDEAEVYAMAVQTMGHEYADRWLEETRREKGTDQ